MKCDQIREIILTDYIDGELKLQDTKIVEQHLQTCIACKELMLSIQKNTKDLFADKEILKAPDRIWDSVECAISRRHKIFDIFSLRGQVFAFSSVAAVIILILLFIRPQANLPNGVDNYLQEQIEFLGSLGSIDEGDSLNLETSIEEYLL